MRTGVLAGFLATALLAFLTTSASASVITSGTEADPELKDPPGDVEYSDAYVGPPENHYLDILAIWFEHQPPEDKIAVTFKTTSNEALGDRDSEWNFGCSASLPMLLDGERHGTIRLRYGYDDEAADFTGSAHWDGPDGDAETLSSTVNGSLTEPGYATLRLDRHALLNFGDTVERIGAQCVESLRAGPVTLVGEENADGAQSDGPFPLHDLYQEGPADPGDTTPSQTPRATSTPTGDASTLAFASLLVGLAAAAALGRRGRA